LVGGGGGGGGAEGSSSVVRIPLRQASKHTIPYGQVHSGMLAEKVGVVGKSGRKHARRNAAKIEARSAARVEEGPHTVR